MNGVLLDTHALIWYLAHPERLSSMSSDAIDDTLKKGGCLFVSAITIVEIIYLVEKEKIPDMPDRIIAAVAQYFNLPLITKDDRIIKAGINTIW